MRFLSVIFAFFLFTGAAFADAPDSAQNVNRLTLEMAKKAMKKQEDRSENLIISPFNALTNMALVGSGAGGATRDEMAKALFGTEGATLDEDVKNFMDLNSTLLAANNGIVDVLTANGIWVNKNTAKLKPEFAELAKTSFKASISEEDFADPSIPHKINTWASENTKGLISKIVNELQPEDAIVLASALYFKGEWTSKFDKSLTEDKHFTVDDQKDYVTPTMQQKFSDEGGLQWQERDGYEAVTLTYGAKQAPYMGMGGGQPSMRIILVRPKNPSQSARAWLAAQDPNKIEWLDHGAYENVAGLVELPHIDITQKHDLIPVLKALGIETAFDGGADFSGMGSSGNGNLFISKVSHDVVFKTDEEGSEAAAITTTTIGTTSAMPRETKRVEVKFDRSFVFALQDIKTGAVLFLGAVNKPNDEMKQTN